MKQILLNVTVFTTIAVAIVVSRPRSRVFRVSAAPSRLSQPCTTNYPQPEATLIENAGNSAAIRCHAWSLIEQLTKAVGNDLQNPGQLPQWETDTQHWKDKCDLDLNPLCGNHQIAGATGALLLDSSPASSPQIPPSSRPMLSTVFYNIAADNTGAAAFIKSQDLQNGRTLQHLLITQEKTTTVPSVPSFPETAIVVKAVWEPVNTPLFAQEWQIQIYDPQHVSMIEGTDLLKSVQGWSTWVDILRLANGELDTKTECPKNQGYSAFSMHDAVPIRCFSYKFDPKRCDNIVSSRVPSAMNPALMPSAPCVVVLVGFQIATREVKNWTWSTFWWTNEITAAPYTDGRPDLPPGFSHFAMDTMIGPDPIPDHPPAVFNPYLEGPSAGLHSNCLSCHRNARYQPACDASGPAPCGPLRNGAEVDKKFMEQPTTCDATQQQNPIANHCPLATSFLWSLADNQDTALDHPLSEFIRGPNIVFSPSRSATPKSR